jgi:hypothetical protein
MHGPSMSFFNLIHYYHQASAFQLKAQHVQYASTKSARGVMAHPDWIGEQGYHVNMVR